MASITITDEAPLGSASRRRKAEEARLGLALAAPIVIVMGALVFAQCCSPLWDSLHRIDPLKVGTPFIGFQHYADLMTDPNVRAAWLNTFAYVVFAVLVETAGGLAVALLLNAVEKGRRWLLAATVLPWALPPVINAIVWALDLQPELRAPERRLEGERRHRGETTSGSTTGRPRSS